jgi:hypothetical protein
MLENSRLTYNKLLLSRNQQGILATLIPGSENSTINVHIKACRQTLGKLC